MADNKKYYYLKLKEDFFGCDEMLVMESMPDGYLYSNILLKLYLRSLKNEGKLMLNGFIPYSPDMLASIVHHQVGTVERALKVFKELGLIEILDNGAIYMLNIQNFIGKSSTEADRKREYRQEIEKEKQLIWTNVRQISDKTTPEIEKELELKIRDKDKRVDYQLIVDMYNDTCVSFPKVKTLSDARKKAIKARMKSHTIDDFKKLFEMAEQSSFLKGGNGRDWSANFDWLIKDANMAKVLDGNYADKRKEENPATQAPWDDMTDEEFLNMLNGKGNDNGV